MSDSSPDRRADRLAGSARLLRGRDDGAFDREFWRAIPPRQRLELVWDMVQEWTAWRSRPDGEPRLQRSVGRRDLVVNKKAAGRPQDLLDLTLLMRHEE